MLRGIRPYKKLGNFSIEPWGSVYFALYEGEVLICVTVYKCGALEVMERLFTLQSLGVAP